ncbi:MAG: PP2C family protein-serine/threonine phosphatase [Thermoanaerobaculia bacterium]
MTPPASLADRVREALRALGEEPGDHLDLALTRVEEPASSASSEESAAWLAARVLARALKDVRFELRERALELQSLYDLGLSVGGRLELDRLADEILLRSISLTNSRSGSLHLFDGPRTILSRSFGGALLTEEDALRIELDSDGAINNDATAQATAGVYLSECQKCLVVPIQHEGRRLGVLAVADKETRDGTIADFSASDERLLMLFAGHAATAVETARLHREAVEKERLERELELAATIQREILPREIPQFPGFAVAAESLSTRQVGGDYYDFFPLSGDRFAFVVADVSGKGVPAALLVSTLASAIHLQIEDARTPADLILRVHRHLYRFSRARKFATLFFGLAESASGKLTYVSAGHNPALLMRPSGRVELLGATGRPVGMFWESTWTEDSVQLAAGDRLCVYTDGITEAQNESGEDFGVPRLRQVLAETGNEAVAGVARRILDDVVAFAGAAPQYDDQTLVLLAR